MFQVRKTFLRNVWARSDGLISYPYPNGPWVAGIKTCVNKTKVTQKQHTPKYYYVHIFQHEDGSCRSYFVHRLVAKAFCPNPAPEYFNSVDHINRDSLDTRSSNLRWCTHALNCANKKGACAYLDKLKKKKGWKKCWISKVTLDKKTYRLGFYKTKEEASEISKEFKTKKWAEIYDSYIKNAVAAS